MSNEWQKREERREMVTLVVLVAMAIFAAWGVIEIALPGIVERWVASG